MLGINFGEIVVLLIVAAVVIGPDRLPEYTRALVRFVGHAKRFVMQSKDHVEKEMGMNLEDLKQYDPRQYDPRRIVREAWDNTNVEDFLPSKEDMLPAAAGGAAAGAAAVGEDSVGDTGTDNASGGPKRAPFDLEAT